MSTTTTDIQTGKSNNWNLESLNSEDFLKELIVIEF